MGLRGSMDISRLVKKVLEVAPALRQPAEQLVLREAQTFLSNTGAQSGMMQITPPSHQGVTGKDAQVHAQAKVGADINRVYLSPGLAYDDIKATSGKPAADAFWAAWRNRAPMRKNGKARKSVPALDAMQYGLRHASSRYRSVTVGTFDGGAEHRNARRRGVVPPKTLPRYLATDRAALKRYIKLRQKNIGLYASTLLGPMSALGIMSRAPAWVRRHAGQLGGSKCTLNRRNGFEVIFRLSPPFAASDFQRRATYAVRYRIKAINRQLPILLRAALRQAQLAA